MSQTATTTDHPNKYFWREGMDLRQPPPKVVIDDLWRDVRTSQVSHWIPVDVDAAEEGIVALAADHLWQGDEFMDALVATWVDDPASGRAAFETALAKGIDAVQSPSPELVKLFEQIDTTPDWFDPEAYEHGRQVASNTSFAGLTGFSMQDSLLTLVGRHVSMSTAATRSLVNDTYNRLHETTVWLTDVTKPDGWRRDHPVFHSIVRLRLLHAQAREISMRGVPGAEFAEYGNPIPATTIAGGAMSFGMTAALLDHWYGRPMRREDLEAVVAYWGYIGYVMGAPEELVPHNLNDGLKLMNYTYASSGGPTEGTEYLTQIMDDRVEGGTRAKRIGRKLAMAATRHLVLSGFEFYGGPRMINAMYEARPDFRARRTNTVRVIGWIVKANVRLRVLDDKLPGSERRRIRRTRDGHPTWLLRTKASEALGRAIGADVSVTYQKHDELEPAKQRAAMAGTCPAGHGAQLESMEKTA